MNSRDGGESFGFAPKTDRKQGLSHRQRAALSAREPRRRSSAALAGEPGDGAASTTPAWLWLLIGIFIGAGGTLFTSSLWLPDMPTTAASAEPTDTPAAAGPEITTPPPVDRTAGDGEEITNEADDLMRPAPKRPEPDEAATSKPVIRTAERSSSAVETEAGPEERPVRTPQLVRGDAASTVPAQTQAGPPGVPAGTGDDQRLKRVAKETKAAEPSKPPVANAERDDDAPTDSDSRSRELRIAALAEQARLLQDMALQAMADKKAAAEKKPAADETADQEEVATDETEVATETSPPAPRRPEPAPPPETVARLAPEDRTGPLYRVQLAAVDNERAAEVFWRNVKQRLPGVFAGIDPIFDRRTVDQRLYFRIWVGAFGRLAEADEYCGWLKGQGQDCFVTRVDNL